MKKIFKRILLSLFLLPAAMGYAQNYQWTLSSGLNAIDFNAGDPLFEDFLTTKNWNVAPAISKFILSGSLNPSFSLDGNIGGAVIDKVIDAGGNVQSIGHRMFVNGGLDLRYKFDNGYILNEEATIAPYLLLGGGLSFLDNNDVASAEEISAKFDAGLGFNFWFWENTALFLQTAANFIPDGDNYLNHSIGVSIRFGEKDSDDDGIVDDEDSCPLEAGPLNTLGCPDADNDGIADKSDNCPQQAGPASLLGCPDADGDGLADRDDMCPNEKGLKDLNGCPDSDGDMIADKDDACPQQKGLKDFNGCPDTDGDGIQDKVDACPTQKGTISLNGCPDRDGDGIADKDDNCPDVVGIIANKGCPEIKQEVIEKINFSAKSIQFETGSDKIKTVSYPVLDVIAEIMQQYEWSKWKIDGHTDNVGEDAKNLDLSNRRAASVKNYFASKGVAADRLTATGYGETVPVADNKTSAGRAQNRRVEIKLNQ